MREEYPSQAGPKQDVFWICFIFHCRMDQKVKQIRNPRYPPNFRFSYRRKGGVYILLYINIT